jgi:hypothetical protein
MTYPPGRNISAPQNEGKRPMKKLLVATLHSFFKYSCMAQAQQSTTHPIISHLTSPSYCII